MNLLLLLKLEIKRAYTKFLQIIFGIIIISILCVSSIYIIRMYLFEDPTGTYEIGVVLPKDYFLDSSELSAMINAKSTSSILKFTQLDESAAYKELDDGKLVSIIIISKEFLDEVMDGTDATIQVIFPKNSGFEAQIIKEVTVTAAKLLDSGQAGMYAADDFYYKYLNYNEYLAESKASFKRLENTYFKYAFSRENFYEALIFSNTNDITSYEYYVVSGVMLFILLLGMISASYLTPYKRLTSRTMYLRGVNSFDILLIKLIALLCLYIPIIIFAFFIMSLAAPGQYSIFTLLISLLVLVIVFSIYILIYEFSGKLSLAMIISFVYVITTALFSGLIIPTMFLPTSLYNLSKYMPMTYIHKLLCSTISNNYKVSDIIICLFTGFISFILAVLIHYTRSRRSA